MEWSLYRWVWLVETSLHIGASPAGMLNRTRLYVPARTLWGALTAEVARVKNNSFPEYGRIGEEIKKTARFGYLFPAEKVDGGWKAWLPRYTEDGLVWQREDGGKPEEDRKFRMRLLSTRPGTAIAPDTDTALEGSLREFEVISPFWRNEEGDHPVALVGYVFVASGNNVRANGRADDASFSPEKAPEMLLCGGDTRYGLGRIRRTACSEATSFFDWRVDLTQANPVLSVNMSKGAGLCVLAHVESDSCQLRGEYELIGGWDEGKLHPGRKLYWKPGSISKGSPRCKIDENGCWEMDHV